MVGYRISQLAERVGVSATTLRFTLTHDGVRLDATAPAGALPLLDDLFSLDPTGRAGC